MLVVLVDARVKPECVAAFNQASADNARDSRREPGIVRFDVLQAQDEPTRFLLLEVYRTDDDTKKHKDTAHYRTWRATVEPMMAQPRSSTRYTDVSWTR